MSMSLSKVVQLDEVKSLALEAAVANASGDGERLVELTTNLNVLICSKVKGWELGQFEFEPTNNGLTNRAYQGVKFQAHHQLFGLVDRKIVCDFDQAAETARLESLAREEAARQRRLAKQKGRDRHV